MPSLKYQIARDLPVTHSVDVAVFGGGPGGLGAAVMAARAGARVLLVERYGLPGGMASFGEVHPFMVNHAGTTCMDRPVYTEWIERMHGYLAESHPARHLRGPEVVAHEDRLIPKEAAALAAEDLCLEAGVQLLYHHTLADAVREGDQIAAAILLSKSGLTAVRAKQYVDCTGDADLAALAGCEFEEGGPSGYCQPMTLCFKLENVKKVDRANWAGGEGMRTRLNAVYREAKERGELDHPREDVLTFSWLADDVVHFNSTRIIHRRGTNGSELSEAEVAARRQMRDLLRLFRERVEEFRDCEIRSMGHHIGVRETRRVKGLAWLTRADYVARSKFPDAIARVNYPIDIHNPDGSGTEIVHMPRDEWYEIPYGCVVARDVRNLTVGGRPISVDHAIHSSMRVMPPAVSVGQAAGLAAAFAAERNVSPHDLDGIEVRNALRARGAWL